MLNQLFVILLKQVNCNMSQPFKVPRALPIIFTDNILTLNTWVKAEYFPNHKVKKLNTLKLVIVL